MSFLSRRSRQPELEVLAPTLVPASRAPSQAEELTELDRLAGTAALAGRVLDPDVAWRLLGEEFPEAGTNELPHRAMIVARPVGRTGYPATCLFVTGRHLYAAGNLGRLVTYDFLMLQSIGLISAGFPQLQVLAFTGPGSHQLALGTFELSPNKETGTFWRDLRAAVETARPDLEEYCADRYGGLGVPPPGSGDAGWYAPSGP
jgi:hypothetical protein